MSKGKSVFVTALVAGMLTAITVGLYLMEYRAWMVIVGFLSLYGLLCGAFSFCQWLGKEPPLLPPARKQDDVKPYVPKAAKTARMPYVVVEDFPNEKSVQEGLQGPVG